MKAVNLLEELKQVTDYWSPRVVGQVNDQFVKVARLKGSLTWHSHDDEDELFLVLQGSMIIEYEYRQVALNEGDFHVVPKGTMHNPVAEKECCIALIETVTTKHTGNVVIDKSKTIEQQMSRS